MEKFDPSMETKVWRRVTAPAPPQRGEDLGPLIFAAQEAVRDYRFLREKLKGQDMPRLLLEAALDTLACLKGLQQLRSAAPAKTAPLPPPVPSLRRVLEQSYHRCRRMAAEYTARSADAQWGIVFAKLAQREQENCVRLAGLLGQTG